jgi:hypothetical protein
MPLKSWLTLAASAAINGALGFLATQFGSGLPSTAQAWTAAIVGTVFGALVAVVHLYQTSPPDLTKIAALQKAASGLKLVLAIGLVGFLGRSLPACAQLQALIPEMNTIENKIVTDLRLGDQDGTIVADVAVILGLPATDAGVLAMVLNDITNLLTSGLLAKHEPANVVANAAAVQASLQGKLAARSNPPLLVH